MSSDKASPICSATSSISSFSCNLQWMRPSRATITGNDILQVAIARSFKAFSFTGKPPSQVRRCSLRHQHSPDVSRPANSKNFFSTTPICKGSETQTGTADLHLYYELEYSVTTAFWSILRKSPLTSANGPRSIAPAFCPAAAKLATRCCWEMCRSAEFETEQSRALGGDRAMRGRWRLNGTPQNVSKWL